MEVDLFTAENPQEYTKSDREGFIILEECVFKKCCKKYKKKGRHCKKCPKL